MHVPSDAMTAADANWGRGLLGDKAHWMVFDNSKPRSAVPGYRAEIPFEPGAREIVAWYEGDPRGSGPTCGSRRCRTGSPGLTAFAR